MKPRKTVSTTDEDREGERWRERERERATHKEEDGVS